MAGTPDDARRDRLALVGQLVADLSHDCNNQLAFVLSNLQNLAEYADELARVVAAYRDRVKVAGLRDPALARLEAETDLEFVLEDGGRAAREGLDGANRLRDVLRTLARLGADEPSEVQLVDLARTVRQAAGFQTKTVAIRAELALELPAEAPALVAPAAVMRAVVVMIKDALAAFGARARAENRLRVALERGGGRYAILVEHNGADPGAGLLLAEEAARELGGELAVAPGKVTLYVPEPEA